jgi:hypothetical protein
MVPIGILCYSSQFLHHEELKLAITSHSSWQPNDPSNPPIFDIYLGDFLANGKKTKMLFVSSEKSKQQELVEHFKRLYDGSKKSYPNGSMMVFIPINDGSLASSTYRDKIYYNHEKSTGDETVFSIGGLNDMKTIIKIKGNHTVSLRTLLKSLPASTGMSHPQLFKHAEPNSSGLVTMVV